MPSHSTSAQRYVLLNRVITDIVLSEASQEQMQAAFKSVAGEIGAEFYFHYRIDASQPEQLLLTSSSGETETLAIEDIAIRKGGQLSAHVAQTREMLVLENVQENRDARTGGFRALGAKAYLGAPLVAHDRLFGTLSFVSVSRSRFSEDDVEFVRLLSDQFAAALDRARLVERLRESEARYRSALITARIAAWETDLVARTRTWTEEGMALFGLRLPGGKGRVGGTDDEFLRSLHPDDKHLVAHFHRLANEVDSFPAEYRVVRPDGSMIWVAGRGRVVARGMDGKALKLANVVVDVTERKKAEENVQLLMREVSHRAKNLLAVVQAIAGQTARSAANLHEFNEAFSRRLLGLAASHDLLVREDWRGAPIAELAREQMAPFAEVGGDRLVVEGPPVGLAATAVQAVGMALHELATNAVKHGAWSAQGGKVQINWEFSPDHQLVLRWIESGGPTVVQPARRGFGHLVAEVMVAKSVDGRVVTDYDPSGLRWTLTLPANVLVMPQRT